MSILRNEHRGQISELSSGMKLQDIMHTSRVYLFNSERHEKMSVRAIYNSMGNDGSAGGF